MRRSLLATAVASYAAIAAVAFWEVRHPAVALASEDDAPLAPELTGGLAWLNVDHPLSLRDLRGQLVILDFWTYG